MADIRIFVDNIEIDISENSVSLPITYQLINIKQIDKRKGSSTKTISVPRTAKNEKIFGFAFDITARNSFDKYRDHLVLIEQDTFPIFNGFLRLTNVTEDIIQFFCFADISKVKQLFGEKTLQDLNLSNLDHLYDETIFDTWSGTYPTDVPADYIYPVIDYGAFQTRTPANNPEAPDLFISDLYPALYLRRAIQQICIDNGFSLISDFFAKDIPSRCIIPFSNDEFIHSVVGGVEVDGFSGTNSVQQNLGASLGTFTFDVDTTQIDPLLQWDSINMEYVASASQTLKYQFSFDVEFPTSTTFLTSPSSVFIQVDRGSGWVTERTELVERPNGGTLARFYVATYEGPLTLGAGDKVRFVFNKDQSTSQKIRARKVVFDPGAGGKTIEVGEFVQMSPNLPKIKQADLFKSCYQLFNWIINVNDEKSTIEIETFEDFYQSGMQVDWSRLLTLSPKPQIKYLPNDYSRKFDFQYKHDSNDYWLTRYDTRQANAGYLFGDGRLYLDEKGDATLIGQVVFSPTVVEQSFNGGANYIELPTMLLNTDPNVLNTGHEPRLLIYGGMVDIETLSAGAITNIYVETFGSTTNLPFAYFQKKQYNDTTIDDVVGNLSFSTPEGEAYTTANLISDYWQRVIESLSVSPEVVAYFNLTPKEISSLNYRNKIFIDYFGSTFRLNRIVYYLPGANEPTKVELIKEGIFTKVVPVFDE